MERRITQWYGANPKIYAQYGLAGHEGVDLYAIHGAGIVCVSDGVVKSVNDSRLPASQGGHNYGVHVRVLHTDGYETIYAHLDSRVVGVGDVVKSGKIIGFADSTGNSTGTHLHLTLKKNGAIIDPMPYLFDLFGRLDGKEYVDLLPIMMGKANRAYMVRNHNGASERYQTQLDSDDKRGWTWYITKNSLWEKWGCTGEFIRLYQDTSPEPLNSTPVYYKVTDNYGEDGGRWCPRFMYVGQSYLESSPHFVKFFHKDNGQDANSPYTGYNRNRTTLLSAEGDTIKIGDPSGEQHIFKNGFGRIGWTSAWGSAYLSDDDAGSWMNKREVVA